MIISTQRLVTFIAILFLSGCHSLTTKNTLIVLGDKSRDKAWVYLCGLTQEWDSPEEKNNREILARIAAAEHIKIVALPPFFRCNQFNGKLCWPHDSKDQVHDTYARLTRAIPDNQIAGFIGFSNGGFFLNKLSQEIDLGKPVISIGSAGYFDKTNSGSAHIYLIVGKEDSHHYKGAVEFYNRAQGHKNITVELITHKSGHVIPEHRVRALIYKLSQSQKTKNG